MIIFDDMRDVLTDGEWENLMITSRIRPTLLEHKRESYSMWLRTTFNWASSTQKHDYWKRVHKRLEKLL